MKPTKRWMVLLLVAGCGAETKPALQAAGALQAFSAQADKFKQRRRDLAKKRQELLGEEEAQTASLSADTAQRLAVWTISGGKNKARIDAYQALLAGTKAAGDAWSAFEALEEKQAAAVAAADTKVAVDAQKLGQVIQALTTLGTAQDLTERVKFYIGFALSTREQIDKLNAQKAAGAADDSTAARSELRKTTVAEANLGSTGPAQPTTKSGGKQ